MGVKHDGGGLGTNVPAVPPLLQADPVNVAMPVTAPPLYEPSLNVAFPLTVLLL